MSTPGPRGGSPAGTSRSRTGSRRRMRGRMTTSSSSRSFHSIRKPRFSTPPPVDRSVVRFTDEEGSLVAGRIERKPMPFLAGSPDSPSPSPSVASLSADEWLMDVGKRQLRPASVRATHVQRYWKQSLLSPATEAEKLQLNTGRVENARQTLGIDVHEARALAKSMSMTTIADLFQQYKMQRGERERLLDDLSTALYGNRRKAMLLMSVLSRIDKEDMEPAVSRRSGLTSAGSDGASGASGVGGGAASRIAPASRKLSVLLALKKSELSSLIRTASTGLPSVPGSPPAAAGLLSDSEDDSDGSARSKGARGDGSGDEDEDDEDEELPSTVALSLSSAASDVGSEIAPSDVDEEDLEARLALEGCKEMYSHWCRRLFLVPSNRIVSSLGSRSLVMRHYGLGPKGAIALAETLCVNGTLTELDLADSWLLSEGGMAIGRVLGSNRTLTKLDLSDNRLGEAAGQVIALNLARNSSLRWISLKGNSLGVRFGRSISTALLNNNSLDHLDLSYNELSLDGARALVSLLEKTWSLKTLSLRWNRLGSAGGLALASVLKRNRSLTSLDLSWNSLGSEAAIAMGEMLAANKTLRHLDLSQNGIDADAAMLLADGLRFNRCLTHLEMNYNPLGQRGAAALMQVIDSDCALSTIGLQAIESADDLRARGITVDDDIAAGVAPHGGGGGGGAAATGGGGVAGKGDKRQEFNVLDPDGHYRLDLSRPRDHAIAEMLRIRAVEMGARWIRPMLGDRALAVDEATWVVPRRGLLTLDFVSAASFRAERFRQPRVHFSLDLAVAGDRWMAATLMKRAILEPGENWLNERLNGQRFEFNEKTHTMDWLDSHRSGLLELDYLSTTLVHEEHYRLDLHVFNHYATAYKLLERVYETRHSSFGDSWKNITYNGRPMKLEAWSVRFTTTSGVVSRHEDVDRIVTSSVRNKWRVPRAGILEFDHCTANPQRIHSRHYSLDLRVASERALAQHLRLRACLEPGENWWNETIDGLPFNLKESAAMGGDSTWVIPNEGRLELDYVITRPRTVARAMIREHHTLHMENVLQAREAQRLWQRVGDADNDEMWINVHHEGEPVPLPHVLNHTWELPGTGSVEFDYIYFRSHEPIGEGAFQSLLEETRRQSSDHERINLWRAAVSGSSGYYLTCGMVEEILFELDDQAEQDVLIEILGPRIVDHFRDAHVRVAVRERKLAELAVDSFASSGSTPRVDAVASHWRSSIEDGGEAGEDGIGDSDIPPPLAAAAEESKEAE
eukprot:PLAT169.3.p1 GENE.PLAT169.3~~PLAT169.3.p1  ORF type:complete len:1250 (+),score=474.32 PLAT169.3:25-3774(+)